MVIGVSIVGISECKIHEIGSLIYQLARIRQLSDTRRLSLTGVLIHPVSPIAKEGKNE